MAFDQSDRPRGISPVAPGEVLPDPLPPDPAPILVAWYEEAHRRRVQPNPNAMTLATVDADGRPSARVVLCKSIDASGGSLTCFTNYLSRKAAALDARPHAAAVFHWDAMDRQVRVEGPVARCTPAENDAYFATRSWASRIGAWASAQSRPVGSRQALLAQVDAAMRRFGVDPSNPPPPEGAADIPRPPHWGGYRLWFTSVELWVAGPNRIHERALWTRELHPTPEGGGFAGGPYSTMRLQP